jgi:hypothetical protein
VKSFDYDFATVQARRKGCVMYSAVLTRTRHTKAVNFILAIKSEALSAFTTGWEVRRRLLGKCSVRFSAETTEVVRGYLQSLQINA